MIYQRKNISLFWWSSKLFENKKYENFGDIVGPYLVKKISKKNIQFVNPKKRRLHQFFRKVYVTAGSILTQIDKNCVVWGSGIISKDSHVANATFLAVRGPLTRNILLKKGYKVPAVFGDPALLLPRFYNPKIKKKYSIGFTPHYVDYNEVENWYKNNDSIKVINLLNDSIENVIDEIKECDYIISSSLHGIIVANTYDIPAIWVKFSNKLFGDDIKFHDYFQSVSLTNIEATHIEEKISEEDLYKLITDKNFHPERNNIQLLQNKLLDVCPFK